MLMYLSSKTNKQTNKQKTNKQTSQSKQSHVVFFKVFSYDITGIHFGDYPKPRSFGKDSPSKPPLLHFTVGGTAGTRIYAHTRYIGVSYTYTATYYFSFCKPKSVLLQWPFGFWETIKRSQNSQRNSMFRTGHFQILFFGTFVLKNENIPTPLI